MGKSTIGLLIVAGLALSAFVASQVTGAPADRSIAAEFLGVEQSRLVAQGHIYVVSYADAEQRRRAWRLPVRHDGTTQNGAGEDGPAAVADVTVDVDRGLVLVAVWYDLDRWGVGREPGQTEADDAAALQIAEAFVREHCPVFSDGDRLSTSEARDEGDIPIHEFGWEGVGPADAEHWVHVRVSAVTGEVVEYGLGWRPPAPESASPVTISEERARQIVAEGLRDDLLVDEIRIDRLWTRSPYAAPGVPVYMVAVEGRLPVQNGPVDSLSFAALYGVNATTGELLTERWQGTAPVQPPWVDRLPDSLRPQVRVTGEAAVRAAQAAVRDDMGNPSVRIVELTGDSPFAPVGDPVYVVQVSFDRSDPQGQVTRKTVSWGVHAETGEVIKTVR